jgi:hypothetical protein
MSLRGIIAGALGGVGSAVAKIGAEEMAQQNRMAVYDKQAELEERKLRLADELSRSRAEWEVSTDGLGGKKIEFETQRTAKVGAAQTGVEVERERTLAPERQKNAVDQVVAVKTAEGDIERRQTLERGADRGYLAAKGALARANESSAARAQAAATIYAHNRRVAADRLRDQAADALKAGNKELSDNLLRQADIGEGKAQAKNFSDVAAFARTLTSLANDIADPMKNDFKSAEEEAAARAEAAVIRQQVARMGENVGLAKGVGGGAAGQTGSMPSPKTLDELKKLPPGTVYRAPDGSVRTKQQ